MEGAAADADACKRSRPETANGVSSGGKRSRDTESFQTGVSSKSKPCTKYFSTIGCPFGDGCHFSHFVPGGYPAVAETLNLGSPAVSAPPRVPVDHAAANSHPASTGKTRMCTKYNTAEGCKFGVKCYFAHGESELGKPAYMSPERPSMGVRIGGRPEPHPEATVGPPAGSFGASATAKISVDASLAGGILDTESFQTGLSSKSKPCTKYFSTMGCPFGDGCHFSHFVPGGYPAVAEMLNLGSPAVPAPTRVPVDHAAVANSHPASIGKTRMCTKYNTAEGCKFGEKCHFAHGERELGKPAYMSLEPHPQTTMGPTAESFGASATAKISVDASLAGGIIGKGGANTKNIYRVTGVKLSICDHDSDPKLKNMELEGSFDQIKQASNMVSDLIATISASMPAKNPSGAAGRGGGGPGGRSSYNIKLCENFLKGTCTFGDRCHFAHDEGEQRTGPA